MVAQQLGVWMDSVDAFYTETFSFNQNESYPSLPTRPQNLTESRPRHTLQQYVGLNIPCLVKFLTASPAHSSDPQRLSTRPWR